MIGRIGRIPDRATSNFGNRWVGLSLMLFAMAVSGPLHHPLGDQAASRYALTGAVWDDQSVVIDGYLVGRDRAVANNRTYSDKAPGQPFWGVLPYGLYRAFGGQPAKEPQIHRNWGLWLVTIWSSVVPAAVLMWLMWWGSNRSSEDAWAVIIVWSGTLLLPMSSLLFGHLLSTTLLYSAFVILRKPCTFQHILGAGALAGLAVVTEYTAAIGVLVLLVWQLRRNKRRAGWFALGGLPPAMALATYNTAAFGAPWLLSYQFNAFNAVTEEARPLFEMFSTATWSNIAELFFGGRGLLIATPIVAVGFWGLWRLRDDRPQGDAASIGLWMCLLFLLLPIFWGNPWGGDSPGPRYMAPCLPFLAMGVAHGLRRIPIFTVSAAVVSSGTMLLASLTNPVGLSGRSSGGLPFWIDLAREGQLAPTTFDSLIAPPVASGVHLVAVAVTCCLFTVAERGIRPVYT